MAMCRGRGEIENCPCFLPCNDNASFIAENKDLFILIFHVWLVLLVPGKQVSTL